MKFVLSSKEFKDIKSAGRKCDNWFSTNQLNHHTKLYKVIETYSPRIVFKKEKK
jgi:hypothetical protein